MQSLLPVDRHNQPLAMAMTWADNRSAGQAKQLRASVQGQDLLQRVGCHYSMSTIRQGLRWWAEQAPEIAAQTGKYIAIKDWILYRLCGKFGDRYWTGFYHRDAGYSILYLG